MNSKCKRTTRKNMRRCLTMKKTYSKQLDCQCPPCLSGKNYVKCVKRSRLMPLRSKKGEILMRKLRGKP